MRTIRLRMLLLFLCGLLISCATLTGGNGSETTNGYVIGRLVNPDGSPAAPTQVSLLTWNYNPVKDGAIPDSQIATTGGTGEFSFHAPGKGVFNIEAFRKVSGERALIAGISVNENDTTFLPDHAIGKPGAIKIILPPTVDSVHGYVYLPGTTRFAGIKNNDALVDSVPAGIIPAVNYADRIDTAQNGVVKTNVPVAPGDTTVIADYQTWKNSKKIILNTTASGADVPGTVMDFPVLIRLSSANFDFSQAKPDGGDLRFSKADGSPLPFEIERWDPAAGLAEVWVKVDTVHGNDSVQSLSMYWGNVDAQQQSNSAAVFDTAAGFAGVWHLGEINGGIDDATADGFKGIDSGATAAPGIVGNSMNFSDGDYLRIPGLLRSPTTVTLSAWVRSDKTSGQDIVSLGDAALIRFDDVNLTTAGCFHNDSVVNDLTYAIVGSGRFLAKTGWHYLAFSIDAAARVQTLYIDGVQSNVAHYVNPINYAGLGTDTYIGVHGNGKTTFNFVGQIDEVRVSDVALKSDWIKLCYMNQKQLDALVQWR